jgi:hypothetical protein
VDLKALEDHFRVHCPAAPPPRDRIVRVGA